MIDNILSNLFLEDGVYFYDRHLNLCDNFKNGSHNTWSLGYKFKRNIKYLEIVKQIIDAVKAKFNCDTIVAIPGRGVRENNMQILSDQDIILAPKYGRSARHLNGSNLVNEKNRIEVCFDEANKPKRILLIDDIYNQGITVKRYLDILGEYFDEIVVFVISKTLKIKGIEKEVENDLHIDFNFDSINFDSITFEDKK